MHAARQNFLRGIVGVVAAAAAVTGVVIAPSGAGAVEHATDWPTLPSAVPGTTPNIADGTVFAITTVGNEVIVGGSFTQAANHGSSTEISRPYLLAFDATTGELSTSFAPVLDGRVDALEPGPRPDSVYVGGNFKTVNGAKSKGVTLLDTRTGSVVGNFKPPAMDGGVRSLALVGSRLFIAGIFTSLDGYARGGLASLDATTGALDDFADVQFAGHHNYDGTRRTAQGGVGPRAIAVNPAGTRMMVVGNFKTADGLPRDQIAMLDLDGAKATVDPNWATNKYTAACYSSSFDTYVTDVQYSADGSYFATTAAGGAGTNSDGSQSLCDAVAGWSASSSGSAVQPSWVDYTGHDSLWSVAISGSAIYVGGHVRWVNNANGSDSAGAGAVPRPGLAALDPASGMPLSWNPGRNPRGAGAYALYVNSSGLYVGSDTNYIGNFQYHRGKVAFFPLAGGAAPTSTATAQLPGNLYVAGPQTSSGSGSSGGGGWCRLFPQLCGGGSSNATFGDALDYHSVDGTTVGSLKAVANTGVAWSNTRGAFAVGDSIFYGDTDGNLYKASFDGTTVGTPVVVDPYDDPTWDSVQTGSGQTYQGVKPGYYSEMSSVTGAFYADGRLYYTLYGKSALYWRWFSPDSGAIGAQEFSVSSMDFSKVAGLTLSGSTLYYANSGDGTLHTVAFTAGTVDSSTDTTVSGPSIDGNDWRARSLFVWASSAPNQAPTASATVTCNRSVCSFDGTASTDADGTVALYSWDFGDGTTGTGATTTHSYAKPGNYSVSLVVTDNSNAQSKPWTGTASVADSGAAVQFIAQAQFNGRTANPSVVVPATVASGDHELLFAAVGTPGVTTTAPTGWTQIAQTARGQLETTVFERTATSADARSTVRLPLASSAKVDLQLVDYSGVADGTPVLATATDSFVAVHKTAPVSVSTAGSWVLSYWSTRISGTATWTLPNPLASRGVGYGTGGGHVDAAIADSGGAPPVGTYPSQTASQDAASGKAVMVSIVLAPSGPPPPNQLPTAKATVSCSGAVCSFDGTASSDPDGAVASYAWDFGDGSKGTAATATHVYAKAGDYPVSLVVTDDRGGQSAAWTGTASVTSGPSVAFDGQAAFDGWSAHPSVTVPSSVQAADTELLFVSTNLSGVTTTVPSGWTQIAQQASGQLETTVFRRTATAADAGSTVTVPLASSGKVALQLVAYAGVDSGPATTATAADSRTPTHTAPAVTVATAGSWVVSFWAARVTDAGTWTLPGTVTARGTSIGVGGGHVDTAIADSGTAVGAGSYPSQTASEDVFNGKGTTISIVLAPGA